ncbi:MAG: phosphatidate cytidylyltransferase [Akkermansia sp.]|nr:phosphatidate cytidylyltransferase [Akkermansia sp.]
MTPKLKTFIERGISTIILLSLLGGAVWWNNSIGYAILVCVLCNLTSYEWFNMLRERGAEANRGLALVAGLVYPWLMAAGMLILNSGEPIVIGGEDGPTSVFVSGFNFLGVSLSLLVLFVLATFFCELYRMDYKGSTGAQALSSAGITVLSFIYPVWLFAFALCTLNDPAAIYNLLWLILATKMSDIWAYVSGVLLGGRFIKRRFSPAVSPKKTWEGIIGSFIITSVCSWYLLPITTFGFEHTPVVFFCVMMPAVFILSVAGDLAGSLIKRGVAIKDSGSLLPGIGGIFDLIDSPAFTASFFAAVMPILSYV